MNKIIEPEKSKLRLLLTQKIESFWEDLPDNNIGCVPEDITELMTNAAWNVLMTVQSLNIYLDEQGLMK